MHLAAPAGPTQPRARPARRVSPGRTARAAFVLLALAPSVGCGSPDRAKLSRGCVDVAKSRADVAAPACRSEGFECTYYTGAGNGEYAKPMREYGSPEEATRQAELDGCKIVEPSKWWVKACCTQVLPGELFP